MNRNTPVAMHHRRRFNDASHVHSLLSLIDPGQSPRSPVYSYGCLSAAERGADASQDDQREPPTSALGADVAGGCR